MILGGRAQWVRGNYIGTDATGLQPLGNEFDGLNVAGGQFSSATGAVGANQNSADAQCGLVIAANGVVTNDRRECGNRIAFNTRNGISGGFNAYGFLSNSIHSNGELGIDVDQFGLTLNSATRSRNFPVLTSWRREFNLQNSTVGTRVFGSITNQFSQAVTIQFFHSSGCDPSGHGEGREYLGSITLPGNGNFNFYLPYINGVVTATSTTRLGTPKTSEFSACLPI
jgi:titin